MTDAIHVNSLRSVNCYIDKNRLKTAAFISKSSTDSEEELIYLKTISVVQYKIPSVVDIPTTSIQAKTTEDKRDGGTEKGRCSKTFPCSSSVFEVAPSEQH